MTTTLFLLRHGATAANATRPYTLQGSQPDSPLIETGILQAEQAARDLAARPIRRIYCSPLARARGTAEVVASHLQIPLEVVPGLIEVDVGLWAGLSWEEVETRWPAEFQRFQEDAATHGYLEGENLTQVRDRVLPVVERLIGLHPGAALAIVSHGVVNRVLLAHWLEVPLRYSRKLPQDNAGVNIIEFEKGAAKVRTINFRGDRD